MTRSCIATLDLDALERAARAAWTERDEMSGERGDPPWFEADDLDLVPLAVHDPAALALFLSLSPEVVLRLLTRLRTAEAVVARIREGQDSDTVDDRLCGDTIHELLAAYDAARNGDAQGDAG